MLMDSVETFVKKYSDFHTIQLLIVQLTSLIFHELKSLINAYSSKIYEWVFFQEPIYFRDSYFFLKKKDLSAAGSAEYKEKYVQLKAKVLEKKNVLS